MDNILRSFIRSLIITFLIVNAGLWSYVLAYIISNRLILRAYVDYFPVNANPVIFTIIDVITGILTVSFTILLILLWRKYSPFTFEKFSNKFSISRVSKMFVLLLLIFICFHNLLLLDLARGLEIQQTLILSFITFIFFAISTISTLILNWKNESRIKRETQLRIEKLELELKELKEKDAHKLESEKKILLLSDKQK